MIAVYKCMSILLVFLLMMLARPTTCFYSTTRPLACDGTNNQFYWLQKERGKELYEGDLVLVWAFK